MPPFALAAARVLTRQASELGGGVGTARRTYAALAAVFGLALVSLTVWLPAPISLTPGERAAIPPTALALGVALLISAALVWYGGRETHLRPALAVMGYALTVIAMRSEEHTSELQSRLHLVCRLLLEKKKTAPPSTHPLQLDDSPPAPESS